MAVKRLTPLGSVTPPIPIPDVPVPIPVPETPSFKPITPISPSGSQSSTTVEDRKKQQKLKEIEKSILNNEENKYWRSTKNLFRQITKAEGPALGKISLRIVPDTINFFGGIAVDVQRMTDPRIVYSNGYRDYLYNKYLPNSTIWQQAVATKDSAQLWDTIPEYINAWENGEAVTPLLLRDIGNLSIVFGGLKASFKAAGVSAAERGLAAEAAVQAGKFADEAAAEAAARTAQRMKRVAKTVNRAADTTDRLFHYSNVVGNIPFKPWIWGGTKLGAAKRAGLYVEGVGGWGARAAKAYIDQIQQLRDAEPGIQANDPRLEALVKKAARNIRISLNHETKAKIRQAVRNQQHESDLIKRTLLNIQQAPKYVDDINPLTNEKWGELSLPENEAVIAILNGRANLIEWLVDNLGMTPEEVSVLGRYDATPEYYLSEAGARLAYDMVTGRLEDMQYERLSDAVLKVGRTLRDVTQRAAEGYGRRTALSPDYLKPIPFWNKLRVAVRASGNKALIALVERVDEIEQQIEAGEIDLTPDEIENFKKYKEELSVTIVEQLPDELALDPNMYPASMRENIEFYRRVRRSLNQGVVGQAEGRPLPPRDGGPRAPETPWYPFEGEPPVREEGFAMPRKAGEITAGEKMLGRVRKNIDKLKENITKITERIAKLEEQHLKMAENLRRYDVVDAYIEGRDIKWIAKKFRLSVASVKEILDKSPYKRAFDQLEAIRLEMEQLQQTIGVKRAGLRGAAADAELAAMQKQLGDLTRQAQNAAAALQAARNINEVARQAEESAVDNLVEEQDKLEDDLYDAETEFENNGGDLESLHEYVDPADMDLFPVSFDSAFEMVLAIQLMTDEIAPVLEQEGSGSLGQAVQQVGKILENALNDAESLYTDAETPARQRVAQLRLQQLGSVIVTISNRINQLMIDPPDGVLREQAIANEIVSIISDKGTQEIIAGTAPLSNRVTGKRRGTGAAFSIMAEAGFWDEAEGPSGLPAQGLGFYSGRYAGVDAYLDAVIEEFSNPQNFVNSQGVGYDGNTAKLVKTVEILARWAQEVRAAKTDAARIELILNPPDYVPPALAKKLLQGTTRDPARIKSLSPDDVTHPMDKFVRKVVDRMDSIIYDVNIMDAHVRQFGTASFLDWNKFGGAKVVRDWSGQTKEVIITVPSVPNEGIVPRLKFRTETPVEAVINAVDLLIEAIKNDEGANPFIYEDAPEGYKVSVDGLTKGKAKYKNAVIKDLEKIRNDLEKAKKLTPDEATKLLVEDNILPDVVPDDVSTAVEAIAKPGQKLPQKSQNTRADYVIIPCGAAKGKTATTVAEMYTGSMFKDALATARQMFTDDRIFVISAEYGLLRLDDVIEPYDKKLGDPGSVDSTTISMQLRDEGIRDANILSLLPNDYHRLFQGGVDGPLNANPNRITVEQYYSGARGIGEQKGRLKKLREENPLQISEEAPGSVILPDDMEQIAVTALDDQAIYESLVNSFQDRAAYERDITRIENPEPGDIDAFVASEVSRIEGEIRDLEGFALSNLGGEVPAVGDGRPRWNLSPQKGQPEWEWWYALPPKTRQRISRDFFYSRKRLAPAKKGSTRSATRTVRDADYIDAVADSAGMSVDQWAEAFLDYVNRTTRIRTELKDFKSLTPDEVFELYARVNMDEMNQYAGDIPDMSIEQYEQIFDRIEYLKAERSGATPGNLRPIADSPADVKPDPIIPDPTIRLAAYEVDVVDAMAKDAANKMRRAQRMTERVKAFEEFIEAAKRYEESKQRFEVYGTRKLKLQKKIEANEEKQRLLRTKIDTSKKMITRLKKAEKILTESESAQRIGLMRGSVPLELAVTGEYPSAQFGIDIPAEGGGLETVSLQGPMYVPTGRPRGFTGTLKVEMLQKGLDGFNTLTSEHYRDGDRHTIFSIRQLALRLGREVEQMTGNEAYKAIVAQFGDEAVTILGEDLSLSLYEKAYNRVSSMPVVEQIRLGYKGRIKEDISIDPDAVEPTPEALDRMADDYIETVDGIAAYSSGVPVPAEVFNLALKEEFGRLVAEEMYLRGFTAVDPYKSITAGVPYTRVTHKTIFLPTGLRELIAKTEVISDPSTWNLAMRTARRITGAMKTTTLVFSVSWQLGDLISNVILAKMSGQDVSVRDMVRRMYEVKQKEYGSQGRFGLKTIWDPTSDAMLPTPDATIRLAQEAPIQDIGASQAERRYIYGIPEGAEKQPLLTRLTGKQYPEAVRGRGVVKVSFRINEAINRISRHAFFLELLDKELAKRNLTIDEISDVWRSDPTLRELVFKVADTANDFLGDFADLSLGERKLVALGIPFYSWAKHIHKVTLLIGRDNPAALRWYFYIGAMHLNPEEDPFNLRYGSLNLFGGAISTNILNPFADVFGGPLASLAFQNDPRTALNTLGPVPRLTSAYLTGMDISKLQPISRPSGTINYSESGQAIPTPLLTRPTELLGYTAQQFPIVTRGLNLLPTGTIPGTRIATGPVSRYGTGEARLDPTTKQPVRKIGGQLAALGRVFAIPGIPYQGEEQIADIERAARARLRSVNSLRRLRALQTGEEFVPVGPQP